MSEAERVQRWRQRQREEGKEPMTIWLSRTTKLRLEDLAATWRYSPSELVEQALAQFHPGSSSVPGTVADTEQVQVLVTDTVQEMLARDLPALVRQLVEGLALEALGMPVTDTDGYVTGTLLPEADNESPVPDSTPAPTPAPEPVAPDSTPAPARKGGRPRSALGQQILTLLADHREGLSAEQIRGQLAPGKPIGDTLEGMRRRGTVRTQGQGRAMRYFALQ
jgi:predicted transcriptional regulator